MTERIFVFSSSCGGVGQSTVCAELAYRLASCNRKVLLVDLCPDAPAMDVLYQVEDSVVYTLADVAEGTVDAEQAALVPVKELPLWLIPMQPNTDIRTENCAKAVMQTAKALGAEFVLVDCDMRYLAAFSDVAEGCFILSTPTEISLRAAEYAARNAYAFYGEKAKLILLQTANGKESCLREPPLLDMIDRVALQLFGLVPYDYRVKHILPTHPQKRKPIMYRNAIRNLASRLQGENVPLLSDIRLDGISRRRYIEHQ